MKSAKTDLEKSIETEFESFRKKLTNPETRLALSPDQLADGTYMGYALDAVSFFNDNFKTRLDFTPESIKLVQSILDQLHEAFAEAKPSEEKIDEFVKTMGSYVGQVMVAEGWKWRATDGQPLDMYGVSVHKDGKDFLVFSKVRKNIVDGESDNLLLAVHVARELKG